MVLRYCVFVCAAALSACGAVSTAPVDRPTVWAASPITSSVAGAFAVWRVSFSWRCNAEGGGLVSDCRGTRVVPDPTLNQLPPDLIHCKTTTTVLKRDPSTNAGWSVARTDKDMIVFRHDIRAQSDLFGAGREIEVAYEHLLVFRADGEQAGPQLGCTFSVNERV